MNITVIFSPFHIYISLLQAYKLISILPKDPRCEVCMAETGSVVPVKEDFFLECATVITRLLSYLASSSNSISKDVLSQVWMNWHG